jgi:hypothetical protein
MPQARLLRLSRILVPLIGASLMCVLHGCASHGARTGPVESARTESDTTREDLSVPIEKGVNTVEIDNPYGEINVRDHDQGEVGVHGVAQRELPGAGHARLVSSREGSSLRLRVQLPKGQVGGRYDMAAYVPKGVGLVLRGGEDRVDARNRFGPLKISTKSGNIFASSRSWLDLETVSGTIRATPLEGTWDGPTRIRSESGQIIVLAPLFGNVSLTAITGGRLSTDFGLSVHVRPDGRNEAVARYGTGSSQLHVSSISGEVILEQAVHLEEDESSSIESD